MKVRKEWIGSKKPATQGNLADLHEDIHVDINEMSQKMATLDSRMGRLERVVESILKVVQSIEGRFKDMANFEKVPERLTKVENDVFKLKLRR